VLDFPDLTAQRDHERCFADPETKRMTADEVVGDLLEDDRVDFR
jgi:hypothetical protein